MLGKQAVYFVHPVTLPRQPIPLRRIGNVSVAIPRPEEGKRVKGKGKRKEETPQSLVPSSQSRQGGDGDKKLPAGDFVGYERKPKRTRAQKASH